MRREKDKKNGESPDCKERVNNSKIRPTKMVRKSTCEEQISQNPELEKNLRGNGLILL